MFRIQRAEYEAQRYQRRYEEVDPANRLVVSTLEKNWNNTLTELHRLREQYEVYRTKNNIAASKEQKEKILALAQDLPHLWTASSTCAKDKKKILRLLIKDITLNVENSTCILHIRWQGGAIEDIKVAKPQKAADKRRFFRNLLKDQEKIPFELITDKLKSYSAAKNEIMSSVTHTQDRYANNRAENSHQRTH